MKDSAPLALVTGASSGIGLEIAKQLAGRGYDLVVNAEDAGITTAAARLRTNGVDAVAVRADLRDAGAVEELLAAVTATGRPLDVAVLNAGLGRGGAFTAQDFADVQEIIDLNVTATLRLAHAVLRTMLARDSGRMLVTSSVTSTTPGSHRAVYNASASFVQSFVEAVQEEIGESAVTITSLMPGPTASDSSHRGTADTRTAAPSARDDAATVAAQGVEAMLKGRRKLVGGSFVARARSAVVGVLPDRVRAAMPGRTAAPGSGEE